MSEDTSVAPVIISLNVELPLRKDKNVTQMLTLPQHIVSLFECAKSCAEARKHGSDIILAYTGEQFCPLQHGNIFFHKRSFPL